ncbi:hypothetical protein [Paraburkholderia kururiensis]|uniref:hypothetical protein n=1 Tax=Paraburkholderia kururiensis TaxID=984307 RepID=UPI000349DD0B|nr:hypothetical protein [Paraburkholderia kururiensis]
MDALSEKDTSLDDELKRVNVEKIHAETEKIRRELDSEADRAKKSFWIDFAKIVGGVILGAGGLMAAITQFEVGEMRAKVAKTEFDEAAKQKALAVQDAQEAKQSYAKSQDELKRTVEMRDAVKAEYEDLQVESKRLRASLTQTDVALRAAHPQTGLPRLVYVQFNGALSAAFINDLRDYLIRDSFNAPGAERVRESRATLVKYFSPADQAAAKKLAASVEAFTHSKGCPMTVPVSLVRLPNGRTAPLEVWLYGTCE